MPTVKRPKYGFFDQREIQPDPCDDKTWHARRKAAKILAEFFDVDGVFFDAVWFDRHDDFNGGKKKAVKGYLYHDRKGRFDHGWTVWSSLKKSSKKPTTWPEGVGAQPSQVRLVKTLYSSYLVFFKEPDPK